MLKEESDTNDDYVMGFKSEMKIRQILSKHDKWFNCELLLQEMDHLIQNWYKVSMPLCEFHPERFVSHSLSQLGYGGNNVGHNNSSNTRKPMIVTMKEQQEQR